MTLRHEKASMPTKSTYRMPVEQSAYDRAGTTIARRLAAFGKTLDERDDAMMRRLQTLTAQVDALSGQVEQLAQMLRPLSHGNG